MPILLDKILTVIALPLGTAVATGLIALAALAFDRHRCAAVLFVLAIVWLWGWSMPLASYAINGSLTDRYPFQRAEELPAADAIVVLGNTKPNLVDPAYPNLVDSSDRAWYAARLYLAGKAPLIVVSAGNVWNRRAMMQSTADATGVLLRAFGVPDGAIMIEDRSRNTRQNALFTAEIAASRGIRKVLLTTSARHMPRAEAAFRQVGLDVVPAVTDYVPLPKSVGAKSRRMTPWILGVLPSAGALSSNSKAFKELLGFLVYRLRGWA